MEQIRVAKMFSFSPRVMAIPTGILVAAITVSIPLLRTSRSLKFSLNSYASITSTNFSLLFVSSLK